MSDDAYDDVRAYDETWDVWAADMSADEKAAAAAILRGTIGYVCWQMGIDSESILGPRRDAALRRFGVIPCDEQDAR